MSNSKTASKVEIPVPNDEMIKAVGKEVYSSGTIKYWYQLRKSGAKMSYGDREKFRYQLRNQAQVVQANKLVEELDEKLPDPKKKASEGPLREFEDALLADKVASRFMLAIEFPTEEARRKYLHDHPNADPHKHTIKKQEGGKGEGEGGKKQLSEIFKPNQFDQELGGMLQQWHGPGSPAITTVGSYLTGRHPVPRKKLMEAAKELEGFLPDAKAGKYGWGKSEVRELNKMIKQLKHMHDEVDSPE
jgi:hypothetical protein